MIDAMLTAMQAQKKKTHRGRRSQGKGPKEHHEEAKTHLMNAHKAGTPMDAKQHLFKALTSLKKATGVPASQSGAPSGNDPEDAGAEKASSMSFM